MAAPALRLAKIGLLLLIASLPFMKLNLPVAGRLATLSDLIFVGVVVAFAAALVRRETALRWHPMFLPIALYFAAMAVSAFVSADPTRSAAKLATQLYLLSLPVLALHLIEDADDLKRAVRWWLAATAAVALLGVATLILFALGVDRPLLEFPLHHFGTLPPGDYPRLELTFTHPAMLCNYLTISLAMLLVANRLDRLGRMPFAALLVAILASAAFTITPGLGGIVLMIGLWYWLSVGGAAGFLALTAGAGAAVLFVVSAALTPIVHPTAPFLLTVPGLEMPLAPSARWMFWTEAWSNFLERPLLGSGIGTDAIWVDYQNPAGVRRFYTDAHNMFLNIAAQCGIVGLAALILLIAAVVRRTLPLRLDRPADALRVGLGLAFLNAFAFQGLVGSFEDARHLWLLLGLFIAAESALSRSTASAAPETRAGPQSSSSRREANSGPTA